MDARKEPLDAFRGAGGWLWPGLLFISTFLVLGACSGGPASRPWNPPPPSNLDWDLATLELGFQEGDRADSVTGDLVLPTLGVHGSRIHWTSSHPETVDTGGRVTRPLGLSQRVVLRALVEQDGQERRTSFPIIVRRLDFPTGQGSWNATIVVDGLVDPDEWVSQESELPNGSPDYRSFVAWDRENLYLAWTGPGLPRNAPDADQLWIKVYLGLPGTNLPGTSQAQTFRQQSWILPFQAHYALKYRPSDFFINSAAWIQDENQWKWGYTTNQSLEYHNPLGISRNRAARGLQETPDHFELAIPRSLLGDPDRVQLISFILSEKNSAQRTWAYSPPGSVAEGFAGPQARVLDAHWTLDLNSPLSAGEQIRGAQAP